MSFSVIDFHSHILPVDHGCANVDESLSQLALMAEHGVDIAVATPHFYPHELDIQKFTDMVSRAIADIQERQPSLSPRVALGAEVLLYPNMHLMDGFEKLYIRGTNTVLLELPLFKMSADYFSTVDDIISSGATVVLAHIDRYLNDFEYDIDTLLSMGAFAQINAYSLSNSKLKKKILSYIENTDKVCAIGSDLHKVNVKGYKKFVKAQKILGKHYGQVMQRTAALLENAEYII